MEIEPTPDMMEVARASTKAVENGIDVALVGERVLEALNQGEFYIFTHPNYKSVTDARGANIAAAFDQAGTSPVVKHVDEQPSMAFGAPEE